MGNIFSPGDACEYQSSGYTRVIPHEHIGFQAVAHHKAVLCLESQPIQGHRNDHGRWFACHEFYLASTTPLQSPDHSRGDTRSLRAIMVSSAASGFSGSE